MKTFHQEYLGIPFAEDQNQTALRRLVESYEKQTEEYDRMVCAGPVKNGRIIPATLEEFSRINRNAQSLRKAFEPVVTSLGFTMHDFQQILIGERKARR